MKKISRHATDIALAQRQADLKQEVLDATLEPARTNPEFLNQLFLNAIGRAGSLSVADPDSPALCEDLKLGGATARALFAAAAAHTGPVEVPLGKGPPARYSATGPNASAHAGNFRLGFLVAAICRDRVVLNELSMTPIDVLRRSSSKADECVYLFADALQAVWKREDDLGRRIQAALEATDPAKIGVSGEDFVLNVVVPEIELMFRLALHDASAFNEALVFALERHKKYWSKGDRKLNAQGWLALGPLALASFAHDAGIEITVESDYLPASLYRGECA